MESKKTINTIIQMATSLLLGGAILYWMYRGFDIKSIGNVMLHKMNWTWMLLSFPFGILAQAFRGWRWQQTLEPLGEKPRQGVSVNSIFVSYAASLIIPRSGEIARCGILKRWEGVSFPKSLGTVVTERAIDTSLIVLITALTLLWQLPVFNRFFSSTGTRLDEILSQFSTAGWWVTAICAVAALLLIWLLLRRLSVYNKVKNTFAGLLAGIVSVVGILDADTMLNYPDFRAYEHAFMMMSQVAGRAGRRGKRGLVILQTKSPDLPVIGQVVRNDYEAFYDSLLEERSLFRYPPFSHVDYVYLKHTNEGVVEMAAQEMGGNLRQMLGDRVLGPDKPSVARVKAVFIRKIVLKLEIGIDLRKTRQALYAARDGIVAQPCYKSVQIYFDVDPE